MARKSIGEFNPTAITFEDVELPSKSRVTGGRKWDDNPFIETLRSTIGGKGKALTLPVPHARELASALRDACEKITEQGTPIGLRLIFTWTQDDGSSGRSTTASALPKDERDVLVTFGAKSRRRTLDDLQKDDAKAMGFVDSNGRIQGAQYLNWVNAGRPMD